MKIIKNIGNIIFSQDNICLFCRENKGGFSNHICTNCKNLIEITNKEINLELPHIENTYYSVLYNKFIRENLHRFKFQGKSYLYKPFGEILIHTIKAKEIRNKVEAITFVPIHRRKNALRGYNQAELLARYIGKNLDIPLLNNHLKKIKWTVEQNTLGKVDRKNNLKDSFEAINIEDFKNKEILLIDDIITTGTTMEECGKVLMKKGAKKVYGLALTSSMKI